MLVPIIDIAKKPNLKVNVETLLGNAVQELQVKVKLPESWNDKKLLFTVRFSDDVEIKQLNKKFRGKDKVTNVLSFPAGDDIPGMETIKKAQVPTRQVFEKYIGDIIISCDTLESEAKEQNKTMDDHLTHLLVHSILHLYGYDHKSNSEADIMETLEIDILRELSVNDPYHK